MNAQDPLAQLHPLRAPDPVTLWPPAPGWWILAGIVALALISATVLLLRQRRANAYRRLALARMQQLHDDFRASGDSKAYASATNALLKRVALEAFPESDPAALHSSEWLSFLRQRCHGELFSSDFTASVYSADAGNLDVDALHSDACLWIRRHRRNA